jgi:hypothetical protein
MLGQHWDGHTVKWRRPQPGHLKHGNVMNLRSPSSRRQVELQIRDIGCEMNPDDMSQFALWHLVDFLGAMGQKF